MVKLHEHLFLGLVDDLGLVGGPLVVGRDRLVVEGANGLLGVSALLGSLGSGHEHSLSIKKELLVLLF